MSLLRLLPKSFFKISTFQPKFLCSSYFNTYCLPPDPVYSVADPHGVSWRQPRQDRDAGGGDPVHLARGARTDHPTHRPIYGQVRC